ncbi:hypothetical protein K488DRAFT_82458 [Vararia minispora EC-137]|uniref:Uncharacterized protein n=1 Tax=Vararia minispora EC-137 TaxID=1314806 RepID=A0ACB8QWF0_9AGAM|nr:hypothetical protein K488DRAFT_82458 [Vararia minispora EC-137]
MSGGQSGVERELSTLYDAYDYIVVGGGNAGCVLARRLSDNGRFTVLLVEKGDAADSWRHSTPIVSLHHFSNQKHSTVQKVYDEQLGRSINLITGRGLGGSTRINGGQYTCGAPGEYNAWAQAGNVGWSYDDLKQYFKKSETWIGPVSKEFHGANGPLKVRSFESYTYKSAEKMQDAAKRLGFLGISDMHSPLGPSFGYNKMQFTLDADGRRQSSFRAYLPKHLISERPVLLHVCTRAVGVKLYFSMDSSVRARADAVLVQTLHGTRSRTIKAKREIVLACGALATPQLLMLSGVGPASHLRETSIRPVVDLPGVGEHLQDHILVSTTYNCPLSDSFWGAIIWPPTLIREIYRYLRRGTGYLLCTLVESEIFGISSLIGEDGTPLPHAKKRKDAADPKNLPDFAVLSTGIADPQGPEVNRTKGLYGLNVALLKPRSAGRVRLRSANPLEPPLIDTNYFSDAADYAPLRAALRVTLALVRSMRENGYPLRDVHVPDSSSDASLDAFIRARADTMMHYSSTCRMARREDARPGVVDAALRVYGVHNLRIADASVFPDIPATHPQAAVYAVAEKCADMMLMDAGAA